MIVSRQLNIFEQDAKKRYKAFYETFYAKQIREAKESREKKREPDYLISINPDTLGEKQIFNNNRLKQ